MKKLELERNGTNVEVIEIANISNKEQLVVGNYDRDLILRTKGMITVQVQNKFFDLLNSNGESIITASFKPTFVTDINAQVAYPEGSLIIDISTGKLYSYYNGALINLSDGDMEGGSGFISYAELQDLDPVQKLRALTNLGLYWDGVNIMSFYEGQVVFNAASNTHQIYKNGTLQDLYLNLITGGTVNGNTTFNNVALSVIGEYNNLLTPTTTDYKGLLIGKTGIDGFGLHASANENIINSVSGRPIIFRMNDSIDFLYKDYLSIYPDGVSINGLPASGFDFTANGESLIENLSIRTKASSEGYQIADDPYGQDFGFILENRYVDETQMWALDIDRIWEKHPEGDYRISQHYFQNHIKKGYAINNLSSDENTISFYNDTGLVAGDLLLGSSYGWDGDVVNYIYIQLLNIYAGEDPLDKTKLWDVNIIGEYNTRSYYKLIKIGNIGTVDKSLLIDATKNNIKIVNSVTDINQLFPNGRPDTSQDDELDRHLSNTPVYPTTNINTSIGNLNEVINNKLSLNLNEEFGLYSNNAYIEGKADLNYLKLGDELIWNGTGLIIKDLETIKSRNITGANGLIGGGNLFAADIVISHAAGSWVNKTNLTGPSVISNLVIDQYGHITDWVIRLLTKADIGLGNVDNTSDLDKPVSTATQAALDLKINLSEKGQPNGVATLDGGGKIPVAQLPNAVMTLEGEWDASTNTPTLVNGTGDPGMVYEVTTAGTHDFGDGPITFAVGDWVVYGADGKWFKSISSNEVTSVNGKTGTVVIGPSDLAVTANQFIVGDTTGKGSLRTIRPSDIGLTAGRVPFAASANIWDSYFATHMPLANSFVLRTINGQVATLDAVDNNHAVNLGQLNTAIANKANINGNNATGTWPISITGDAQTWNGLGLYRSVPQDGSMRSVLGVESTNGFAYEMSKTALLNFMGADVNPTPNSVVQRDFEGSIIGTYLRGLNNATDDGNIINGLASFDSNNYLRKNSKQAVNQFLGMPANGDTLQSVLDRGREAYGASSKMMLSSGYDSEDNNVIPVLGDKNYRLYLSNHGSYGMQFGVTSSGLGYIQQARTDGNPIAYPLILQPTGGNVGIGTVNPNSKLDVYGVISATGGNSTQWNEGFNSWNRGALVSNVNAADNSRPTGNWAVELRNGSDNTNFPNNAGYGTYQRVKTTTFTTDFFNENDGAMFHKTFYHGGGGTGDNVAWRRIWTDGDFSQATINNWNQAYANSHAPDNLQSVLNRDRGAEFAVNDFAMSIANTGTAGSTTLRLSTNHLENDDRWFITSYVNGGGSESGFKVNHNGVIFARGGNSTQWNQAYNNIISYVDDRTIQPNDIAPQQLRHGFTSLTNNELNPYADFLHFGGYQDGSGGKQNLILFRKSEMGIRQYQAPSQSSSPYTDFVDYWHTGNLSVDITPTPSTVVKRDVNGYVEANFIKTPLSANSIRNDNSIQSIYGNSGADGYHYSWNASAVRNFIGATSSIISDVIVQRDGSAQINVPATPTLGSHAASKAYVDSKISDGNVNISNAYEGITPVGTVLQTYNLINGGTIEIRFIVNQQILITLRRGSNTEAVSVVELNTTLYSGSVNVNGGTAHWPGPTATYTITMTPEDTFYKHSGEYNFTLGGVSYNLLVEGSYVGDSMSWIVKSIFK